MSKRATLLLICAALAGGCGADGNTASQSSGDPESGTQNVQGGGLAAEDVAQLFMAEDSIATNCGLTENQQGSDIPLGDAITTIANVYRQNPKSNISSGSVRQLRSTADIVRDNAELLRDCGKTAEADRLESVLEKS